MRAFLTNDGLQVLESCKNLKEYFGKPFNEKTVKLILQIRSDIDKEVKKQTMEACKEILNEYDWSHTLEEDENS